MKKKLWVQVRHGVGYFVAMVVAVVSLFPMLWMLLASFKTKNEVLATPLKMLPEKWVTTNYTAVLISDQNPILRSMVMTLAVAVLGVLFSLFINMMAS